MYKIFSLLIFCLLTFCGLAQVDKTDSLKMAMQNYKGKDTIQVINMIRYGYSLSAKDPHESIKVFSAAIELAKELKWNKGLVELYVIISGIQSDVEIYDASIMNLLAALKIAEANNYLATYFQLHCELSESYRLMKDISHSGFHAQKALDISKAGKNEYEILSATVLLGAVYEQKNQWDSASPLLDQAMTMAFKLKDENIQQQIISIKANHLVSLKDYAGALQLNRQNLLFHLKKDNKNGIAWVYTVISRLYTDLNNKDSAYRYANAALQISKEYNLTKELKDAYETLFTFYYKFGDYKKALEYRLIFDSIYNATYSLATGQNAERARMELEQERKDVLTKTETIKKEAETARERNLQYMAIGVFALGLLFSFWNNRQKQKAKTAIEKAYTELKSTQSQLIQSEKMASLGELTAGIAHEIQNPLNFVNNFSEVNAELIEELKAELAIGNMQYAIELANDIRDNSEKINHHGKRAGDIVKGMLQHSRSSSGTKEPTDINTLCDEYLRLSYHGLRAKNKSFNAEINTDFDETIGKINIIPQDIGRVVLNLLTNAFYAVDEKKKTGAEGYEPTVTIDTKKVNDKIEISVTDNGDGIPQKILDKIFQPFFTTKPTGQGTGLGLSLSYDIVKAHSGELKVETKEGEGSTFIMMLPLQ